MSYYSLVFEIPKNTLETAPYEMKIPVTGGILHQVSVLIPPGHAGLTGVAIDEGLHQIAPSNQNEWFKGDDSRFLYPEYHELPPDTRELTIRGFNLDDTYNHSFVIGLGVMPLSVYHEVAALGDILKPMSQYLQNILQFIEPPGSGPGA